MEKRKNSPSETKNYQDLLSEKYGPKDSLGYQNYLIEAKINRVGNKLRSIRERNNLTQQELAERIGTQKSFISRIENGADMNLSTLIKICEHGLKNPLFFVFGEVLD